MNEKPWSSEVSEATANAPGLQEQSASSEWPEDLFRVAVETAGEAFIVTDAELNPPGPRIEYVNPGFTRMTGYAPEEVIGKTPRILQGPATSRAVLDRMRGALERGEPSREEATNYRKDGSEYVVEWVVTPYRGEDGSIRHWVSAQRDVTERRRAEARQQHLLDELNHRVQNTLASVQSIASQTARAMLSPAEFKARFQGRLFALSRVHKVLTRHHWARAALHDLVSGQMETHPDAVTQLQVDGEEVWLRAAAAIVLGMALHELIANAGKHGALSVAEGQARLAWSVVPQHGEEHLKLRWTEANGPPVVPPEQRGFGSRLIEYGLAAELGGQVDLRFERAGLQCEIDLPLARVAA